MNDPVTSIGEGDELGVLDQPRESLVVLRTHEDVLLGFDDQRRNAQARELLPRIVPQDRDELGGDRLEWGPNAGDLSNPVPDRIGRSVGK